jgi:hypothetical protein
MVTLYLIIGYNKQDNEYEVYSDHTEECDCRDAHYEASLVYDRVIVKSLQIDEEEPNQ